MYSSVCDAFPLKAKETEREDFPPGFFEKERPKATKGIDDDEPCFCFCNAKTRQKLAELPDETVVVTELCDDNETIVVPAEEFINWLYGYPQDFNAK